MANQPFADEFLAALQAALSGLEASTEAYCLLEAQIEEEEEAEWLWQLVQAYDEHALCQLGEEMSQRWASPMG